MLVILLRWINNPGINAGGNGAVLAAVTQSDVFKYRIKMIENWVFSGSFQREFSPMSSYLLSAGGVHFGNVSSHQPI